MPRTVKRSPTESGRKLADATVTAIDNLADSWAAIDRVREAAGLAATAGVPANAKSASDWSDHYGLPMTTANHQLAALVKAGKMHKGTALRSNIRGHMGFVNVYWPVEP